jgi:ABC-2 type transport system ATP-binding protein
MNLIADPGSAIRTDRLGKRYRRTWALRDCTLDLPTNRVIALVGPNGAGKTTLLRIVVGLIAPTTGTVTVFGESPAANTPQALARVGFVAQENPLYRRFTVADLLRFGRACNLRWDQQLAERRLSQLGISLDRKAGTLSGGQQAQVALALAMAKRPDVLVLDEPLSDLDPLARREFLQTLMGVVADRGITVLFSSHVVSELERVCDHLVVLNHGRVVVAGDIEALLSDHRLLVGPRAASVEHRSNVIEAAHGDRHTTVLVRDGGGPAAPGWQAQPVSLEDLVLAYLRRPVQDGRDRLVEAAEVPA